MKKFAWLAGFLVLFSGAGAPADGLHDFGDKMSRFYLAPSREAFDAFQQEAERHRAEMEGSHNGAAVLVSVMIARISEKYGWPIANGELGEHAREILAGKSKMAKFIADDARVNPSKLDVWWVSYFATGEERYLEKILHYAGVPQPKSKTEAAMVIAAASWSFRSNTRQHPSVLAFAKKKLAAKAVAGPQAQFLRNCIADAEAQPVGWVSGEGKAAPNSDSMKSVQGFGGWLVVTPDADWRFKLATAPVNTPTFHGASSVKYGERVTILPFYVNPATDAKGEIKIACGFKLTRPDGSVPVDNKGMDCASGKLQGDPRNVRLSAAVVEFIGEDSDPPGTWRVEVSLTDKNRNVTVPLKVEFTLLPRQGGAPAKVAR